MGVTLQSHNTSMQLQSNTHPLKVVGVLSPEVDSYTQLMSDNVDDH